MIEGIKTGVEAIRKWHYSKTERSIKNNKRCLRNLDHGC